MVAIPVILDSISVSIASWLSPGPVAGKVVAGGVHERKKRTEILPQNVAIFGCGYPLHISVA